jgi:hypothetical protein
LPRVEGAEKVSGVWLYAADNLRPGNVVGAGCCTDPITMRILNIDVSRAKNPLGPRQGAWAHRHMYEEVNDVLSGRGTVSSKIAALIGAKTMSGVFPFLAGISLSIPRSLGAVSGCITTDRSWRISALCISNKMKGSDE